MKARRAKKKQLVPTKPQVKEPIALAQGKYLYNITPNDSNAYDASINIIIIKLKIQLT